MTMLTMAKALNAGLRRALEADPKVVIAGEDVGKLGGVFRVTEGLQKDFGEHRVIDSPLAESGIVGTARGDGAARLSPGVRDPVRWIRLSGVRPDRQLRPPGCITDQRGLLGADRDSDSLRRGYRCRRASQRITGGLLLPYARAQGRDLLQSGRRVLDDPAGHRLRRPDHFPRTQAPLSRAGRGGRVRRTAAIAFRAGRTTRTRCHA